MAGVDHSIAQLAGAGSPFVILAVALLLGLRHASDPDHLAAVSTLIASKADGGVRSAGRLGLAWGIGHATTLLVFGLPIALAGSYLPEPVQRGAELLVGLLIVALAIRLLVRWRRDGGAAHSHARQLLGRSPRESFGIGLVHGMGGSAGVGVLLLAGIPHRAEAALALALFAAAAALSMAMLSSGFGYALTRGPVMRRMFGLAPGLGVASLAFGTWYALGAAGALPYPL